MGRVHVLAIPCPAQGHVIPLLELSQRLVKHGFRITFVNTDYNHKRVLNALENYKDRVGEQINMVSIPDGMELWEDRNEFGKFTESIFSVMPGKLEELINRINSSEEDEKISYVIADQNVGWALDVAAKLNIPCAAFWPASAAILCLLCGVQKLIDDGIIDSNGNPLKKQMIKMDPTMPAMSTENLVWNCIGDPTTNKIVFEAMIRNNESVKVADWIICNSAYDLEPGAFTSTPNILPVGPLLASCRQGESAGYFWQEDSTCLKWLDQQPPKSVVYVAFGSITVLDKTQFQELALGLELSGKPFLWVVRPDITSEANAYPDGFHERVGCRGKMVEWAPQQKVLSHPSVACFLSHCGWNSTIEGVANGVPFLCWPYFADQLLDESYICDVWKVGLKFDKNESGIITKEEIENKVRQVLSDEEIIARASELKEIALLNVGECGYSTKIFNNFIEWMKN